MPDETLTPNPDSAALEPETAPAPAPRRAQRKQSARPSGQMPLAEPAPSEAPAAPAPETDAEESTAAQMLASPVEPAFTFRVANARLQAEVSQTLKQGDDFYKFGGTLELPLDESGQCDPAQLEGALASLSVVTQRLTTVVAKSWQAKQQALAFAAQRRQVMNRLTGALQRLCVPPAEAEAALNEFFGGVPTSPVELPITLAKIDALLADRSRPEGWRWVAPPPRQKFVPAPHGAARPAPVPAIVKPPVVPAKPAAAAPQAAPPT